MPKPSSEPIPILFAASTYVVGGAERVVAHLIRGLNRRRFRPEVLALRGAGAVGLELRADGIPVHEGLTGASRLDPWLPAKIRRVLRQGRYRAIYFLDHPHAVFPGVLASIGTDVTARVMPVHTTGQWGGRKSVRRPIRLVLSKLDRVIAIAEAQRRFLIEREGIPESKLAVIRNGVPLSRPTPAMRAERRAAARRALGTPDEVPVIGITAVLRPEKNHEMCLRAFARVRARHPRAELWIVGDGPRRGELERLAGELGLAASGGSAVATGIEASVGSVESGRPVAVRFLGHAPDARAWMAGFDVAVLSSHPLVETLPLTIIEAMDEALPVVATRVGALEEMVEEGRSGHLVEAGDEAGFAEAIDRLLTSRETRRSMGEAGQEIAARKYSVERMCEETEQLLLGLLRERC